MAQVAITKMHEGVRAAVLHITISADGSGELSNEIIADPAQIFDPALASKPGMTIEKLWYDLTGFNARMTFDYLAAGTPVWSMSAGQASFVDFQHFGGLKDRSNAMDGTGKLMLTTSGLTSGTFGTIIIKLRKD